MALPPSGKISAGAHACTVTVAHSCTVTVAHSCTVTVVHSSTVTVVHSCTLTVALIALYARYELYVEFRLTC